MTNIGRAATEGGRGIADVAVGYVRVRDGVRIVARERATYVERLRAGGLRGVFVVLLIVIVIVIAGSGSSPALHRTSKPGDHE